MAGRNAALLEADTSLTLPNGQRLAGKLAYKDEFTIAMTDAAGIYHSWLTSRVTFTIEDPREAHFAMLAKYTNADLHNVFAYLQSLK